MADSTESGGGTKRKRCTKCGKRKAVSKFWKTKQSKDGYHWHCADCKKAQASGYYYADIEKSRAYARDKANLRYKNSAMVEVACCDCGATWLKRKDTLKVWSGRCRSCAGKKTLADPAIREMLAEKARLQIAEWGGRIPNTQRWGYEKPIRGADHPRWQGGITAANKRDRSAAGTVKWREDVYLRDHFTCQECGQVGGKLNAHHIKPWADFPDLRFDIDNGVTLCRECHMALHAEEAGKRLGEARDRAYKARRSAA